MAHTCRQIDAPPAAIFAVLADPLTYPDWLIGASEIRDHDATWPQPGSQFHHMVGIKPFVLADSTTVTDVEPGRSLRLRVKARPLISAVATFTIVGDGDRSIVCIEEEPALRVIGNLVRPLLDPLIHHRNHRSLRRLDELITSRPEDRRSRRPIARRERWARRTTASDPVC